jgi:hypothetical protein
MMERRARWRQLDLLELATNAVQPQQFDPIVRAEITSLLKQLFNDCSVTLAKTRGADNE